MNNLLFKIFTFITIVLLPPLVYAQGVTFLVAPPTMELSTLPGVPVSEGIEVSTPRDVPLRLKVSVSDWVMDQSGALNFLKASSTPTSCTPWVKLNRTELLLPPQGRELVRFTITPPASAHGTYWCVIFVESYPPDIKDFKGVGMPIAGRVGALVFLSVLGKEPLSREGKVIDVFTRRNRKSGLWEVGATFENSGEAALRPHVWVEIKDQKGKKVENMEVSKESVALPRSQRDYASPWPSHLPPGNYLVTAYFDYGKKELFAGELLFEAFSQLDPPLLRVRQASRKGPAAALALLENKGTTLQKLTGELVIRGAAESVKNFKIDEISLKGGEIKELSFPLEEALQKKDLALSINLTTAEGKNLNQDYQYKFVK